MGRKLLFALVGLGSYLFSMAAFAAFALWISGHDERLSVDGVDGGPAGDPVSTWGIDNVLLFVVCLYHSGAARPRVKRWLLEAIPQPIERSVYNAISSLLLLLLMALWRPVPAKVWSLAPAWTGLMHGLFIGAWALMFLGIVLIHHHEFFGLRQVGFGLRDRPYEPLPPVSDRHYTLARVPLMLGLLLIPWATATMSVGHLYFSVFMTAYCVLGSFLSKRDAERARAAPSRSGA